MHPLWDEIINTFNLSPPDQLYTAPNCIYQSLSNYSWPFETLKWFYKCFAVCSQLLCKVMHVFTSFFVVVEKQYFIFSLSCMRWLYTRIFADLMQFFTIYFRFSWLKKNGYFDLCFHIIDFLIFLFIQQPIAKGDCTIDRTFSFDTLLYWTYFLNK